MRRSRVRSRRGRARGLRRYHRRSASTSPEPRSLPRSRSALRWLCPRPRSCFRWSARKRRSADRRSRMLLFEDLALVPIVFALGAMGGAAESGGILGRDAAAAASAVRRCCSSAGSLLPHLFAQAARTKNPGAVSGACLLIVIIASLVTSAVGFSPVLGALIAGHRHRRDRISRRSRGDHGAVPRARPRHFPDHGRNERRSCASCAQLAAVLARRRRGAAWSRPLSRRACCELDGARTAVAAETGVLMASPSETTLIVLASAAPARD